MTERRSLIDQVAIITGAGRGIGAATARLFAGEGAHVVCAARSEQEIAGVAESIREAGGSARAIRCDVTRPDDIAGLIGGALSWRGQVDILINNAGTCQPVSGSGFK